MGVLKMQFGRERKGARVEEKGGGVVVLAGRGGALFVVWFLSWIVHVSCFTFFLCIVGMYPPSPHASGGSGPHSHTLHTHTHREVQLRNVSSGSLAARVPLYLVGNYAGNGGLCLCFVVYYTVVCTCGGGYRKQMK